MYSVHTGLLIWPHDIKAGERRTTQTQTHTHSEIE